LKTLVFSKHGGASVDPAKPRHCSKVEAQKNGVFIIPRGVVPLSIGSDLMLVSPVHRNHRRVTYICSDIVQWHLSTRLVFRLNHWLLESVVNPDGTDKRRGWKTLREIFQYDDS
jgi:hypothetical protein